MDNLIEAILRIALALGSLGAALAALASLGNRIWDHYRGVTI